MLCLRYLVISSLVLLLWSSYVQVAVQDEAIATCRKDCIKKLLKEAESQCTEACVKLRQENITQGLNVFGNQENLPPPGIPTLVSSRFSSIRLTWNTTGINNSTTVMYILEIDPYWIYHKSDAIVVYPDIIEKYLLANETVHTVKKLLANQSYQFRVAAVTLNGSSFFSEWSNLTSTNNNCEKPPCHVTNVRIVLTWYTDEEYKGAELRSIFQWEPTTGLTEANGHSRIKINRLSDAENCRTRFGVVSYEKEVDITHENQSFHTFIDNKDPGVKARLYFGCDYKVKIWHEYLILNDDEAIGTWIFHIPFCNSLLHICGCKHFVNMPDRTFVEANFIRMSENRTSINVTWSDESWTNVTYYGIRIQEADPYQPNKFSYVFQKENIHNYNKAFYNLQNNQSYEIVIYAFDKNNCTFNETKKLQIPDPTKVKQKTTRDPPTNPTKTEQNTTRDPPSRVASNGTLVAIVVPISVIIAIVIIVMVGLFLRKYKYGDGNNANASINILYIQRKFIQRIARDKLNDGIELFQDRIEFGGVIGEGAFGKVYQGKAYGILDNPGWTTVAIKRLGASATCEEMDNFFDEIRLMKKLGKHKNVIQMHGCCTISQPVCIIMEYASLGSLWDCLKSLKQKDKSKIICDPAKDEILIGESKETLNLILKEFLSFARQIANGMTYVSNLGIVHRDLAARNILLNKNKVIKIADFGLSRGGTYICMKTRRKMPFRWLPIEAMQEGLYSTASDVWEFGVVLWEMYTLGDIPYPSVPYERLLDFLRNGKRMEKPENCSDKIYDIMLKCWSYQTKDRPKFRELHMTFMNLEDEAHFYVNINPPRSSLELQDIEKNDAKNKEQKPFKNASDPGVNGIGNTAFINSMGDLDKTCDL